MNRNGAPQEQSCAALFCTFAATPGSHESEGRQASLHEKDRNPIAPTMSSR